MSDRDDRWRSILEQADRPDMRWQILMPDLTTEHGGFVWAMKAQEEMGELSAVLLSCLGHRKEPKDVALVECDQLIAVLLRVRELLETDPPAPSWCKEEGGTYEG